MTRLSPSALLALLLALLLPLGAAAEEGSPVPLSPLFGELSPSLEALLEPAPVPPEALSDDEPPVLARPDARVLPFGERVPRVHCLPYRACSVLLEAGEAILHLALGDSERWLVEEVSAPGSPLILLKPLAYNLLTNLVVRTDRRLYVIELVSPQAPPDGGRDAEAAYDAIVRFSYPGQWSRRVAAAGGAAASSPAAAPGRDPSRLHFDYTFDRPLWPRHRLSWTPDVVYDDGERTYIRLPAGARHRDLPAVLVAGEDGEPAPTDTTLGGPGGDWLVVPAVAPELRLVVGSGRGTRRLTLVRTGG